MSRLEREETKRGNRNLNPVKVTLDNRVSPGRTRAERVLFYICVDNCFLARFLMWVNQTTLNWQKLVFFFTISSYNCSIDI